MGKMDQLSKVKVKLEVTLDELEDSLEREKKSRLDMEKQRRKVEAELTVCQEKESDIAAAAKRLEDEQNIVGKLQKSIKELQSRIEINEEELEAERQARTQAEKQRGTLAREFDDLSERVDEAGGATAAQIELNKKGKLK